MKANFLSYSFEEKPIPKKFRNIIMEFLKELFHKNNSYQLLPAFQPDRNDPFVDII